MQCGRVPDSRPTETVNSIGSDVQTLSGRVFYWLRAWLGVSLSVWFKVCPYFCNCCAIHKPGNWHIGSFFGKDFQSHAATIGRNCIRQIGINAFETSVDSSALQIFEIVQFSPRMNGRYFFVAAEQPHALKCSFEFQAPVSAQFRIHPDDQYGTVSSGFLQSCWLH